MSTSNRITRTESLVLTNAALGATLRRARTTVWPTDGVSTAIVVLTNDVSADGRRSWQITWDGTRAVTNYSGRGLPNEFWVVLSTNRAPDGSYVVSQSQYGRLTNVTRRASNGTAIGQTSYSYEEHGRLAAVIDARNGATTYAYNRLGQQTRVDQGAEA